MAGEWGLEREARWRRAVGQDAPEEWDGVPDPALVLSSASLSRSIYYSSASGLPSPGFLGTDLLLSPLVNWWESSPQLPGVESHGSLCSLCSSLFLSLHPHSFLLSFPSLPFWFLLSLVVVVAVAVQLRWRAVRLSLHYQRVAGQRLSHLKWKAEQRLRVMNPSWEPETGQRRVWGPEGRAGPWALEPCLGPQTGAGCAIPLLGAARWLSEQ